MHFTSLKTQVPKSEDNQFLKVVLDLVHKLACNRQIPTIRANLERLILETERLEKQLAGNRFAQGRVLKIRGESIEQAESFKRTPPRLEGWQQAYRQAPELLRRVEEDLSSLESHGEFGELIADVKWLRTGAEQIADLVKETAQKAGLYHFLRSR